MQVKLLSEKVRQQATHNSLQQASNKQQASVIQMQENQLCKMKKQNSQMVQKFEQ